MFDDVAEEMIGQDGKSGTLFVELKGFARQNLTRVVLKSGYFCRSYTCQRISGDVPGVRIPAYFVPRKR